MNIWRWFGHGFQTYLVLEVVLVHEHLLELEEARDEAGLVVLGGDVQGILQLVVGPEGHGVVPAQHFEHGQGAALGADVDGQIATLAVA